MSSNLSKEEAIRLVREGKTVPEIAKMYNIATGSVYKKIRELNLRNIITAETEQRRLKAVELYEKGWTVKEISEAIGIAKTNVEGYLKSKGIDLKARPKPRSKAQQEYSKLVEQKRVEAVKLYNEGVPVKEIAEKFKTTEGRIYTYLKEKGLNLDWKMKAKNEKKALVLKYYVEEGKTKAEVLKLTGVKDNRFYKYLKEENIPLREDHSYRDKMREQQKAINEETLRVFKENGESFEKTAEVLGVSHVTIRTRLKDLLENPVREIRMQNEAEAIRLRKEGESFPKIAEKLGISIPTARKYAGRVDAPKRQPKSTTNTKTKRLKKFKEPTLKIKKTKRKKFTKPKIKVDNNNQRKNTTRKEKTSTTKNIELSKPEAIEEVKPKKTTTKKTKKQPKKEFIAPEAIIKINTEIKKVNDVLIFPEIPETVASNMPSDFVASYNNILAKTREGKLSSADINRFWNAIQSDRKITAIIDSVFISRLYEYIGDRDSAKKVLLGDLQMCQKIRNMMKNYPATNPIMKANYEKYTEETDKKEDKIQTRLYNLSQEETTYTLDFEK